MIQALIPYGIYEVYLVVQPLADEAYTISWLTTKAGVPHLLKHQQVYHTAALQHILAKHPALPILLCLRHDAAVVMPTAAPDQDPLQVAMGVAISDTRPFFWQVLPTVDGGSWTAVMRKNQVEDLKRGMGPAWERVLYVNAHPGTLAYLLPLRAGFSAESVAGVSVDPFFFGWENGLTQMPHTEKGLRLEDLADDLLLEQGQLWPMATFVHYSLSRGKDLFGWQPEFGQHADALTRLQRWGKGLGIAASILLISLMTLGGLQLWLQRALRQGQQLVQVEHATLTKLSQQQYTLQHYQQTNQQQPAKLVGRSKVSLYLDQIGKQLGGAYSLSDLYVAPSEKVLKKYGIDPQHPPDILLAGSTMEAYALGATLDRIKVLPFVRQVDIHQSTFDFEHQFHRFTLIIYLHSP